MSLALVLETIVQITYVKLKGTSILESLELYEFNGRYCLESVGLKFIIVTHFIGFLNENTEELNSISHIEGL